MKKAPSFLKALLALAAIILVASLPREGRLRQFGGDKTRPAREPCEAWLSPRSERSEDSHYPTVAVPNGLGLAETLGDDGWLKALRLDDYAPRAPRRPKMLQQALFAHTDVV